MCDCNDRFLIEESGRLLCSQCGVVRQGYSFIPGFNAPRDALMIAVYERRKRFRDIMNRMLYPCIENKDMPMFKYLSTHKPFESVTDLLHTMKKSGIADKRYVSLHAFSRRFLKGYVEPITHTHRTAKLFLRLFNMLETVFYREYPDRPWFNYNWLLRRMLIHFDIKQYLPFVKAIKCPKRRDRYEEMFTTIHKVIQALDGAENCPKKAGAISDDRVCRHVQNTGFPLF